MAGRFDAPGSDRYASRLRELAVPDLYRRNAFRVLGLRVIATARQIRLRKDDLKSDIKYGSSDSDGKGSLRRPPAPGEL